jgi:hypothetical protein
VSCARARVSSPLRRQLTAGRGVRCERIRILSSNKDTKALPIPPANSAVTGLTMAATQARPARMAVAMIMWSIAAARHWPLPLAIVGLHCSRTNGVTYHLNGR